MGIGRFDECGRHIDDDKIFLLVFFHELLDWTENGHVVGIRPFVGFKRLRGRNRMDFWKILRNHLRGSPKLLSFREFDLFLRGAPLETALAVADAEMVEPRLADLDRVVRKVGVDADLVDDRVVAQFQLELRIVLAAGGRVGHAVDPGDLLLRLMLHPIEHRHPIDRLVAEHSDEPLSRQKIAH